MSKDRATNVVHRETITSTAELNRALALNIAKTFSEKAPTSTEDLSSTIAVALIYVSAPDEKIDYIVTVRRDGQAFADKKRGTRGNTNFKNEIVRKEFTTEMKMAIQSLTTASGGVTQEPITATHTSEPLPTTTSLVSTPITAEQRRGAEEATYDFKEMIALHNKPITRNVELGTWSDVLRKMGLQKVLKALDYLLTEEESTALNDYLYSNQDATEFEILTYLANENNTSDSTWSAIYKYFHHQVYTQQFTQKDKLEGLEAILRFAES